MNPVAMTIISPQKEYWPSQGLNQQPPVLKSCMLPTELWARPQIEVFADILNLTQNLKLVLERVENVGKGENAGYHHFLLFPHCFQQNSFPGTFPQCFQQHSFPRS